MRVEADAGQMPEKLRKLLAVRLRQGRLEQRLDILPQVSRVAGAEQCDVDARLVPRIAIRRLDHARRAVLVHQEAQRIVALTEPFLDQALRGELLHLARDARRICEDAPHREHQKRADPLLARHRKHVVPRDLMHHVEANHVDFPHGIVRGALQHLIGEIGDRVFGDADVHDLALALGLDQRRHHRHRVIILVQLDAVQIEHVDVFGAHGAQRVVDARGDMRGTGAAANLRLGRNHHLVARDGLQRLSDHALGAVVRRGVDEVDAELHGLVDEPRGLVFGLAGFEAEPAESAGAKACNADAKAGLAESCVFHADGSQTFERLG
jgi:hypothetical protein